MVPRMDLESLMPLVFTWKPGQKHSFMFDKVFIPDASQEDVFVEISQLVQSALDGYKVNLLDVQSLIFKF